VKVQQLQNAVEAFDFNIFEDEHIPALGKLVADKQVVFVKQKLTEERHYDILDSWGSPGMSPVIYGIGTGKLKGLHWNAVRNTTARIGKLINPRHRSRMQSVTFQKDRRGRALGIFTNGKLGWHSDQPAFDSAERVVGLASVEGSDGSQTTFLSTAECYDDLNCEDRSQVDELKCVYRWDMNYNDKNVLNNFAGELIEEQHAIMRYNGVPLDGLTASLKSETASGVPGIHFPGSLFGYFMGMTVEESRKYLSHIWSKMNQPQYIYTHNWRDGEVCYMDQAITLHARPTSVEDGDTRRMWRCSGYLDKLYPGKGPMTMKINVEGEDITWDELFKRVDEVRLSEYKRQKWSKVFERMP
jgi:alpha-ketoglutarate-dependent taurine dioxygenase